MPSLTITREVFETALRNKRFSSWEQLVDAVPADQGGQVLMAALSLALLVLVNVAVWFFIFFAIARVASKADNRSAGGWLAFVFLVVYDLSVSGLCHTWRTSDSAATRMVSSLFISVAPATTSIAAYLLGLLFIDSEVWHKASALHDKATKSEKFHTLFARVVGVLAVLPGLWHSLHLFSTLDTGFEAAGLSFDALALCVFVDVARLVVHLGFLAAPPGKSGSYEDLGVFSIHLVVALCLGWYALLGYGEVGGAAEGTAFASLHALLVGAPGTPRVRVLAALTSYLFLPATFALALSTSDMVVPKPMRASGTGAADAVYLAILAIAVPSLFAAGAFFDIPEPTFLGALALLLVAFWAAHRLTAKGGPLRDAASDGILGFISVLLGFAAVMYGSVSVVDAHAQGMRTALRAAMVSGVGPVVLGAAITLLVGSGLVHVLVFVPKKRKKEEQEEEQKPRRNSSGCVVA